MQFKEGEEQRFLAWKANQTDDGGYGKAIFEYAERWADLMEAAMAEGKKLQDVAEQTSHDADTDGITGFMHGAAVSILSHHWEHGETLRQWHNLDTQLGTEGEEANKKEGAVLNPALLSIGTGPGAGGGK